LFHFIKVSKDVNIFYLVALMWSLSIQSLPHCNDNCHLLKVARIVILFLLLSGAVAIITLDDLAKITVSVIGVDKIGLSLIIYMAFFLNNTVGIVYLSQ
jgi:hypothetical protein